MFRRKRRLPIGGLLLAACLAALLWLTVRSAAGWLGGGVDSGGAREVVSEFYTMEREGNFGGSWELFHSQMKEHFAKDSYIQKRAHVFMQDFGVDTFGFELGELEEVGAWRMGGDQPQLEEVFAVPVTMTYLSSFGAFEIRQDVFVAQESGEWKVLWSYQGESDKE
ncbi:hypothetical protein ACTHPH_12525 [Paenibacillus pasadenensis]|uniref:hypothetical protein n=1 Tax=Paenibacillus pasadenensis TaxID=217090 RepID=UPI0004142D14|nr:hypothetical protein [Paenibacillus pasadenensis]